MDLNEIKDLVAWAYEKGAYEIAVDGHSFKFSEPENGFSYPTSNLDDLARKTHGMIPNEDAGCLEKNEQAFAAQQVEKEAASLRDPAIRSQDPDEYAQMADQWANYRPLTNRP